MQVCHGKAAPLRRIQPGDGVAYYSPTIVFGSKIPHRAFTAAGIVAEDEPYIFDMGSGFHPWRRNVCWHKKHEVPIAPLLVQLDFCAGKKNWGHKLRFGLVAVAVNDFNLIVDAMSKH